MSDTSPASQHTAYGPHEDPPTDYATAVRGHPNPSSTQHTRFPSSQSSIEPLTETLVPDMQTEVMFNIFECDAHKALMNVCDRASVQGLFNRVLNPKKVYEKMTRSAQKEHDEDLDEVQKWRVSLGNFLKLRATPGTDEMKATLHKGEGARLAMLLRMAESATLGMTAKQLVKQLGREGYTMDTYNSLLPLALRTQGDFMEITEVNIPEGLPEVEEPSPRETQRMTSSHAVESCRGAFVNCKDTSS